MKISVTSPSFSKNEVNLFWNADNSSNIDKATLIEHTIKYGDFDDITKVFKKFDKNDIKDTWLKNIAWDRRFEKINLLIARVFFDMDIESDYFQRLESGRFKDKVFVR